MIRVNIWLTETQIFMLENIAQVSGYSRSELIRQAIDAWFEEKEKNHEHDHDASQP